MSAAGRSLFVFGIYQLVLGIVLIIAPNSLLGILGLAGTAEVWIHAAGAFVLVVGFYNLQAGLKSLNDLFLSSIIARVVVLLIFGAFVLLSFAKPIFIAFGAMELIGAVWTFFALQRGV
jgi:hypothetical protein